MMKIRRSRSENPPYGVLFEKSLTTSFSEAAIVYKALSVTPHEQEIYGITDENAAFLAEIGTTIQYGSEENGQMQMNLETLRLIGVMLLSYAHNTTDQVRSISSAQGHRTQMSARRLEGSMAMNMVETIEHRGIVVPLLLPVPKTIEIGFRP